MIHGAIHDEMVVWSIPSYTLSEKKNNLHPSPGSGNFVARTHAVEGFGASGFEECGREFGLEGCSD